MKGKFRALIILPLVLVFCGCKKESASGLKAVFSYVADGYKVNFTNFSTNAKSYHWDFGDGSGDSSTARSPQHIFTAKGDFLVTLTASNGVETDSFTDTVTIVGPNIKVDNDLTDWQYVGYTYEIPEEVGGSLRAVKTFSSNTDIFFYLEGTADMSLSLFDMYIDADNDPATGYNIGDYPAGSGADFLLEGPSGSPSWGSVYTHSGGPNDFSFTPLVGFDDAMVFGPITTVSGKKVMEFSVKKSTLGVSTGTINFSITELTSGWAEMGKLPEGGKPESKFINVQL